MELPSIICMISLLLLDICTTVLTQSETCSYTFIVPSESASQVWLSTVSDNRMLAAENTIGNQQALINYQQGQIQLLAERIAIIEANNSTSGEALPVKTSYVRWGRKTCPSTSQLVYDGYAGKAYFTHGGGVNYQCLPTDPEWPDNTGAGHQSLSYMYGVEYQNFHSPVWPLEVNNHDVPCVVCLVQGRSTTRMIPAKRSCPQGWTLEYSGLLVSQKSDQAGSTFECLDSEVEYDVAGYGNTNGGLFFIVEAKCGSLPCPPYIDGYELSCVVCTK